MSTQNNASDSALVSNHQRGSPSMNTHDDDLHIRLGRIHDRGGRYNAIHRRPIGEPRGPARRWLRTRRRLASAIKIRIGRGIRGQSIASCRASQFDATSPRQSLDRASPRAAVGNLSAHVRYLKRDGVTGAGDAARMFTRETDLADALLRQPMRARPLHTFIHICLCKNLYATALRYDGNYCTRRRNLRLYVRQ
jgi:hypothetical protein